MTERFLTSGDAACVLDVTVRGVRWLVQRGELRCAGTTLAGLRLFLQRDVEALVMARARRRLPALSDLRPRMVKAGLPMGQLRLPMMQKAKVVLPQGEVKVSKLRGEKRRVA